MNYRLAKEIYSSAWFIDPITFQQYIKTLEYFKNGNSFENTDEKSNSFGIFANSKVISANRLSKEKNIDPNSIALYNFDGPITKYGGMSHYGTTEIAAQFSEMEKEDNVIGHIFFMESGGGAANAIKYIRDVSAKGQRTKPLVAFAEDIMASAAMYIASDADWIIANSKDAVVGSIGTMIELEGYKNGSEDKNGKRHLRIYATPSTSKNEEYETAINDLDYTLIKSNILDPHAKEFIADMEANRPNITAKQKTGAIFRAEETIGTLIDEIGDFNLAVNKILELSGKQKAKIDFPVGDINKTKNKNMDLQELKANHPLLYKQAFDEGVAHEKDRAEAWAVYNEVNPEKVKAGIESGKPLSGKDMAEFNLQIAKGEKLEAIRKDNADELQTPEGGKTQEEIEAEKNKAEMDELFGKTEEAK